MIAPHHSPARLTILILCLAVLNATAATEEEINQRFPAQPGGRLVMDVDLGAIEVATNATSEVVIHVYRNVTRSTKAAEEAYLRDHPVIFKHDGNTVTITARRGLRPRWSWTGRNRNEARYTVSVPSQFAARLKTSGGAITVTDLAGEVNAETSGGALKFARLRGPLDGHTSGGAIRLESCDGKLKIATSGGGIDVTGGQGTLTGESSGGSIAVVGSSRVDLQACKLEYSIVSPK